MIVHANLIAARLEGFWRGVLVEGPSGAGKSDLTLRALAAGFRLVADDRVVLWRSGGRLFGRAPRVLAGLIEARGLGVLACEALPLCAIVLVARCSGDVERAPEDDTVTRLGLGLPAVPIAPLEPSAPVKLAGALERLGARR